VGVSTDTDNKADFYQATVLSATDYYAFGMSMKERSWQSDGYRYGFNGKEKDTDIGEEISDFDARLLNKKIGRWFARDPMEGKYPAFSTYGFAGNSPIFLTDPNGKWIVRATKIKGQWQIVFEAEEGDNLKILEIQLGLTEGTIPDLYGKTFKTLWCTPKFGRF
jgi:RHS repeat-associated protein